MSIFYSKKRLYRKPRLPMNYKNISLNLNIRGLGQSATLAINEKCNELIRSGKKIYKLGLGQSPFPVPSVVVEALKHHAHQKEYLPVKGLGQLREVVAGFHKKNECVDAHPEGVMIGPGSKELMFLLQLCYYGDILLPSPCWVSYGPQAKIIGRNVSIIHTTFEERWRISPERLSELIEKDHDTYKPRLLILNYPGNPEGATYGDEELQRIAETAREYEMILLSDEIYAQLNHNGQHISVAKYYPEGTIISSGISKWCGAGGWRLGTFTFPPNLYWLLDAMAAVASETYTSVSAPIQYAAITAFRGGLEIERYLAGCRKILKALGNACAAILASGNIRVHNPQGAFYLFLDFEPYRDLLSGKGIDNSIDLCSRLLEETGVAILPGESFQRPSEELTARMAYVNFDGARALAACEQLPLDEPLQEAFLQTWCAETLDAVKKISDWVVAD